MIMEENSKLIIFGPVPSRRLGRSLGINIIPPKNCSYSCVYCQVGKTSNVQAHRQTFYEPEVIFNNTDQKLRSLKEQNEPVDYLTFVSDGEPTLDVNLGRHIELLKLLGTRVAVITNASLIWQKEVQDDLCKADLVSLKIDAANEDIWHKINNPQTTLNLGKILQGVLAFSNQYKGELLTETMLVQDINDKAEDIENTANFIAGIKAKKSFISVPIRPPVEKWVKSPNEEVINTAYQIFKEKNINVETIIGYEGDSFFFSGNIEKNLLSIASVHPLREESVREFLKRTKTDENIIRKLLAEDKLKEVRYKDKNFYVRKLAIL